MPDAALAPQISVCVCTYQRAHLLARLLDSLARQHCGGLVIEIVIVDNDADASAASVVSDFSIRHPGLAIKYVIEAQQGISFARNRSVASACGSLVAFIDDDEEAAPDWLANLHRCYKQSGATAVFGPVLPQFPAGSSGWATRSSLFHRPRHVTGSLIGCDEARTGNALIAADWLRRRGTTPFLESLALSGGEDHEFFKWVEAAGGSFAWANDACVSELVPVERQRIGFILERRLRTSSVYWRSAYADGARRPGVEAIKGGLGGIACLLAGLVALPAGLGCAVSWWCKAMNGFGRLLALTDMQLRGYGRPS